MRSVTRAPRRADARDPRQRQAAHERDLLL